MGNRSRFDHQRVCLPPITFFSLLLTKMILKITLLSIPSHSSPYFLSSSTASKALIGMWLSKQQRSKQKTCWFSSRKLQTLISIKYALFLFLSPSFWPNKNIRKLIDAVEDHSDQHINEDTVSALVHVKSFFEQLKKLPTQSERLASFLTQITADDKLAIKVVAVLSF